VNANRDRLKQIAKELDAIPDLVTKAAEQSRRIDETVKQQRLNGGRVSDAGAVALRQMLSRLIATYDDLSIAAYGARAFANELETD
jgi:hypothetical protein